MNSIVFDIDGTICPVKKEDERYEDLVPYSAMIEKIKELRKEGYKIVLFTARNMRTYNGNLELILRNTKPVLEKWLKKWDIPYDELIFGKPWVGKEGFYVDDKAIRPKEFINMNRTEIEKLLENSHEI